MLTIYNVKYSLKEQDNDFNLRVLIDSSAYLESNINEFNNGIDYERHSDIFDNQFLIKYSVNNDDKFKLYKDCVNSLEIDRTTKKSSDLSTLRYKLVEEIEKSFAKKFLFLNNVLGENVKLVDNRIYVRKYSSIEDITNITELKYIKNYYLYDVTFDDSTEKTRYYLVFTVDKHSIYIELEQEQLEKNLENFFLMLGKGFNETEFNNFLKNKQLKISKYYEDNIKRSYLININDARQNFILNIRKFLGKFMLCSGKIVNIPLNLKFNGVTKNSVVTFLSDYTKTLVTLKDVENYELSNNGKDL